MNEWIPLITFLILLITLITYWVFWKYKSLFHPGFYFVIIWLVAVPSQWYLTKLNLAALPYPIYVNELNLLVAFTSLCFFVFSFLGLRYKRLKPRINILFSPKYFEILSIICLLTVVVKFIYSGASFNMGLNRLSQTQDLAHVYNQSTFIDSILSILGSSLPILSVLAGYFIGKKQFGKKGMIKNIFLIIPFLSVFLETIMIGGRNPLANVIKLYLLGYALSLPLKITGELKQKVLKYVLIVSILFVVFTTFVANQRTYSAGIVRNKLESPIAESFSGIMDYMSCHYWGYQLRREDYTSNDLKYGVDTFFGFININIPFSSQLNINAGLPSLLGINHDPLEIYKSDREGFYTTYSIYIQMISDFGIRGVYIFILLFTLYTHWLFINIIKRPVNSALSFIFFYLCFAYWSSSNFSSVYGVNLLSSIFIPFFLFDFIQSFVRRSPRKIRRINNNFAYSRIFSRNNLPKIHIKD